MTQREDFGRMIADLKRAGVSFYKLAGLIENRLGKPFQYVQVERIAETNHCEHFVGKIIIAIHTDLVSLQGVSRAPTITMTSA